MLSIYSSKEVCKENLLESYSFHFAYDGEKVVFSTSRSACLIQVLP